MLSEKILEEMNMELVELDFFSSGPRKIVRLYIDKENGVTIADCSRVSHQLSVALDLEDLIQDAYHLEVSSPGLDRPLKTPRDYQRNLGKLLKVNWQDENGKSKTVTGILKELDDESIRLSVRDNVEAIPISKVLLAKVEVQI